MFNPNMESRIKNDKIPLQTLCVLIVIVLWNIMQQKFFLYVAVKALKMAVGFGECGCECLSGPGNTGKS